MNVLFLKTTISDDAHTHEQEYQLGYGRLIVAIAFVDWVQEKTKSKQNG